VSEPAQRIAVIRAGALGDFLLGRPALAALRAKFQDAHITIVAPEPQVRIARWDGLADAALSFEEPTLAPLVAGEAREWPPTLALPDVLVAWLKDHGRVRASAERLGVRRTLGCAPLDAMGARTHTAAWLRESLAPLGAARSVEPAPLRPAGAAESSRPYMVVHPGSGSRRKNFAQWPAVLERLAIGLPTLVIEGPADAEAVGALLRDWPRALPAPVVLRALSLESLAAQLAGAALYLGNDSGVSHLAAAVGTPTVVAFGPTDPAIWMPVGRRVAAVGGTRVAEGIFAAEPAWPSVEEVVRATRALLGQAE
jgi:ADP-heptose:LPS heptosyltransferase